MPVSICVMYIKYVVVGCCGEYWR